MIDARIFFKLRPQVGWFWRDACKSSALLSSLHFSNKTIKNTLYQNICSTLFIINSGVILPRPSVLLKRIWYDWINSEAIIDSLSKQEDVFLVRASVFAKFKVALNWFHHCREEVHKSVRQHNPVPIILGLRKCWRSEKRKRWSEKIRAEEREEKDHTMKEFENVTNLLRKSREDLSDTTFSPEDREDLICTHQLLMNQKKKLQQTLFPIS